MRGVRDSLALVVATAFLAVASVSCGGTSAATAVSTPRIGGTYNLALAMDPISIEPLNAQESEGILVARQVFEGLVRYDLGADGCLHAVPGLADNWSVSADARVFTFTIRKGVHFQAPVNREMTARDVKAAWTYVTDPENGSVVSYPLADIVGTDNEGKAAGGLTGVKVLGRYRLQITLKHPFADFPSSLGHTATMVWPVDYMRRVGHGVFQNRPVGTGPFKVERWDHGQAIELVKNPVYWDSGRRAYVDKVHLSIITDPEKQWQAFERGELDLCEVPRKQMAPSLTGELKRHGWTIQRERLLAMMFVGMNMRDAVVGGAAGLPLRQAITYAVDRSAIIAGSALWGSAPVSEPAGRIVPRGIQADPVVLPYPESVSRARTLVSQMTAAPTVGYLANIDAGGLAALNAPLRHSLEAAGIRLRISGYHWGKYLNSLASGRGVQLFAMGWIADSPSPDNFLYPLFHSSTSTYGSFTAYKNPAVDRLLDDARATLDEKARLALYAQAERQILADAPLIPLYFYKRVWATSPRVQNQVVKPNDLLDMSRVWVK